MIFGQILGFGVGKNMFLSFSGKSHAESFRNFVKKQILDPKHTKFKQKSKSDMSGPARTCPGGQVLTANQRKYFYFFRNYTFPFFINKSIILL